MNDFLPEGYKTPEMPSNYMDLEVGKNAFRILSSAIIGYEWWVDAGEGRRKPKRVRTAGEVPTAVKNATDDQDCVFHGILPPNPQESCHSIHAKVAMQSIRKLPPNP